MTDGAELPRKRIFVVGVPRSGTTMVQGMLNAHPDIVSFPESHFFSFATYDLRFRMYGDLAPRQGSLTGARLHRLRGRFSIWRGKSNPYLRERIALFLERADLQGHAPRFAALPDRIAPLAREFIAVLDEAAGDGHWVEKTPHHAFFTDLIERHVPGACFIHVIRRGEDALASIMDAAQKYPLWRRMHVDGENTIPRLTALWNRSVMASIAQRDKPNHLIFSYEAIVADPERHSHLLNTFLDLPRQANISGFDTFSILAKGEEPWKMNMGNTIRPSASKFEAIFSAQERDRIRQGLITLPPDLFEDARP